MLIISILTVVWFVLHTVDCSCDLGSFGIYRFGPDCRFMCHCKNNEQCDDTTGECSSGCASFWYGPGCQYRDIAEGEFSEHSDNLDSPHKKYANLANDGNSETCSYTAEVNSMEKQTNPFWRVWLPTTERISELMILTKVENLDHFEGFEVYVENVTANERENNEFQRIDSQTCYRHTGDAPKNESVKVLCENPVVGNQVRIQLGTFRSQLVLCDVKINGGRNLAFDRDVSQTQSSGFTNPASNAVDGHDKQSVWIECSFTVVDSPLLKLDIGRNALIWYIRILPVKDKIKEHLRLQLADDKATLIEKTVDIYPQTQSANITLNTAVTRYVTITNPGKSKRLQICELKVFGDCLEDECGFDCSKTCHCKYTNIWDKMDGECSLGCKHGWAGFSCDHCGKGKYGQNCSLKCSDNCNYDGICNNVDGTCVYGCKPGYSDGKCEQECQSGSYGQNCLDTCPSGCNDGLCDNVNGKCQSGCNPGYYGERCENKCSNGIYGQNCSKRCSDNCFDGSCSNVDGNCVYGCKPGYFDGKCEKECPKGKYGQNCDNTCSKSCTNGLCDNVDGKCIYGCKPGYVGTKCEQKCDEGMYGEECIETCGYCLAGATCDHEIGTCLDGCAAGYHGQLCKSKCSDGHWGPDCISVCGHCADSSTCSIYTGTCPGACRPGWLQPLCIYAEKDGHFHSVDIIVGPTVAVVVTGVVVVITLLLVLKRRNSLKPENPVEANEGTSIPDINEYERVDSSLVGVEHETHYVELQLYEKVEETVVAGPK